MYAIIADNVKLGIRLLASKGKIQILQHWLQLTDECIIFLDRYCRVFEYSVASEKYFGKKNQCGRDFFAIAQQWKADFSCLSGLTQNILKYSNSIVDPKNGAIHFMEWKISYIVSDDEICYMLLGKETRQSALYLSSTKRYLIDLENFINDLPGSAFWKDKQGVYLGCNAFTAYLVGAEHPAQVVGKTDYDFSWGSKKEIDNARRNDNKVMVEGKSSIIEESTTLPNGESMIFLVCKMPLRNNVNEVVGIIGIALEITEHKKHEVQLEQAREKAEFTLSNIIEQIPSNVYWKDKQGVYLGCNSKVVKMAGLKTTNDIIGKTDKDLSWKSDFESVNALDKMVLETGQSIEVEETGILGNGERIFLRSNKGPLRNRQSEIIGVIGSSVDITDRKKLEVELEKAKKDAEAYLQNAVEQIPGYIYWKDSKGVYLGCNSKLAKSAGLSSPEDIVGKTDEDLPWGAHAKAGDFNDEKILESGIEQEFEETRQLIDGKQCIYLTRKSPLLNDEQQALGVIAVSFDVTEHRQAEQQRLETLQSFGSIVAHELRTPLVTIGMGAKGISTQLSKLFKNKELRDAETEVVQKLLRVADNIAFEVSAADLMINIILTNVKTKKAKDTELKECSIVECVEEALKRYPFSKKHVGVVCWGNQEDFTFVGEENLLAHVLFNLIKNALYFIDAAGKGKIHVSSRRGERINFLYFKDTGPGISAENLLRIFDRFYSRRYHGVGLGLAFCKIVMEKFGGDIKCDSVEGEYTEFVLSFPAV